MDLVFLSRKSKDEGERSTCDTCRQCQHCTQFFHFLTTFRLGNFTGYQLLKVKHRLWYLFSRLAHHSMNWISILFAWNLSYPVDRPGSREGKIFILFWSVMLGQNFRGTQMVIDSATCRNPDWELLRSLPTAIWAITGWILWQSETDVKAKKEAKTEKKRKSNHPDEEGQFTMAGAITKGRRRGWVWKYHQECSGYTRPNQVKIFVRFSTIWFGTGACIATIRDWPGDNCVSNWKILSLFLFLIVPMFGCVFFAPRWLTAILWLPSEICQA